MSPPWFRCRLAVRYRDLDPFDHVNNAVFASYLEAARVAFWRRYVGSSGSGRDLPFVVARLVIDYLLPVHLDDELHVELAVAALGRSSFTFAYRVLAGERLAARGETVQVCIDPASGRPVPIPETLRTCLEAAPKAATT